MAEQDRDRPSRGRGDGSRAGESPAGPEDSSRTAGEADSVLPVPERSRGDGSAAAPSADRQSPSSELMFVLGSSRRTKLRSVEQELGDLWLSTGEEARLRGRGGVVRVRELNLVVYAQGEEMAQRVSDVVTRVAQCHPGRVIVLLDQGGAGEPTPLEAWVTAACYVTQEGGRQVCWEQITLPVSSQAVPQLFGAAVPLLVSDLPVVIWWPGEADVESRLFQRLGEIADRAILDTAGWANVREGLGAALRLVHDSEKDYQLDDLNWARLTPWREMIAEPFDDPARRALLQTLEKISISYSAESVYEQGPGSSRPAASRALLVAGWLTSRLGWQPSGASWRAAEGGYATTLTLPELRDESLELVLTPQSEPACPGGGLGEVTLFFRGDGHTDDCLSVARSPDTCVCAARLKLEGREALMKTVEMLQPPEDRLLCEELDDTGPDPVYEEALEVAFLLAELEGSEALWR